VKSDDRGGTSDLVEIEIEIAIEIEKQQTDPWISSIENAKNPILRHPDEGRDPFAWATA